MNERKEEELPQLRYFDYKDAETLLKFVNQHGRIIGRKHSKLPASPQRQLALAVKNARFMGFLPYVAK